jgi:hypothetical protein
VDGLAAGVDPAGGPVDPLDARVDPLDARVEAVLGFAPVFGDLAGNRLLVERVRHWHRRLVAQGSLGALK